MAHILITGGAGFIGSHLARRLLDEGNSVTVADSLLTGSRTNIAGLEGKSGFRFLEIDVTASADFSVFSQEKFTQIFHLASPASPNKNSPKSYIAFPVETMLVNSIGTYYMLLLAQKHGASFLFTSSSEVYGDPAQTPQKETYFGNVNPNGPRSVYDEAKRFGEAMTFGFFRKYGVDVRAIRIFNTFGPSMQKDDGRVVSNFINQALAGKSLTIYGDGSQTRSFCYVSDMVEGLHKAMFTNDTKGEVFNLGNPDERTIKQLAELIRGKINASLEIEYMDLPEDDPKRRKPDITKANEKLNWTPKVSIEEGLDRTIGYFKNL